MSLASVMERVAAAVARSGRSEDEITVVVVSKERSVDDIASLYEAGHRHFGENRAQELVGKVGLLPEDVRWHFVGPLQTNKVRLVRPAVTLLHSLDRAELARAWIKGPGLPPPALLQVNIGRESQKQGIDPNETLEVFAYMTDLGVHLAGVMAIPPLASNPEDVRPYFRALTQLSEQVRRIQPQATEISMGMTDDFEVAIEEGATFIRVGRAIFDETAD